MKSLFSNLWKGPVTSVMGLVLFVYTVYGLWTKHFDFLYNGAALLGVSLALSTMSDTQIKEWISRAFNTALDFFKKSAPFILAALLFMSCGVSKHVKKNTGKTTTETDSSAQVKEKTVTETTTTIEADTSATAKGSTVSGSTPVKDLSKKPFVLEDENQTITVRVDSAGNAHVTGVVKDRKVALKFRKRIDEKVTADRNTKTHTKQKASSKSKTMDKEVERSGPGWWVRIVIVILILLVMVYLTLRKKFPFLP